MVASIRNYWNDGHGPMLFRYAVLSYGTAAIGWLLSPPNLLWVFPSLKNVQFPGLDTAWWVSLVIQAAAWLIIVISGICECGWPGIILLLPVKYGLFLPYLMTMIFIGCFFFHDCI